MQPSSFKNEEYLEFQEFLKIDNLIINQLKIMKVMIV
jgi:hypothetical protein